MADTTIIALPLRTARGQNNREHWATAHRRISREREAVAWYLKGRVRPALPVHVTLVRLAPSDGLDTDNLAGALKATRDEVASWLGVDDSAKSPVRWEYQQIKGVWGVRIELKPVDTA